LLAVIIVELEGLPTFSNLRHSLLLSQCVHLTEYSFTSFIFQHFQTNI